MRVDVEAEQAVQEHGHQARAGRAWRGTRRPAARRRSSRRRPRTSAGSGAPSAAARRARSPRTRRRSRRRAPRMRRREADLDARSSRRARIDGCEQVAGCSASVKLPSVVLEGADDQIGGRQDQEHQRRRGRTARRPSQCVGQAAAPSPRRPGPAARAGAVRFGDAWRRSSGRPTTPPVGDRLGQGAPARSTAALLDVGADDGVPAAW